MKEKVSISVIIEPDGEYFHAFCPSLTGLHTDGKTRKKAYLNARDAVIAYIRSIIKHGEVFPVEPIIVLSPGQTQHFIKMEIETPREIVTSSRSTWRRIISEDRLELGRRVAALRIKHGLTQMELAARAGTKQRVIARLEIGKYRPSVGLLRRIAAVMNMRIIIEFVKENSESNSH